MADKKIKKEKTTKEKSLQHYINVVNEYVYYGDLSKQSGEEPAWEKVKEALNTALAILEEFRKKTRLTNKNDMRFTCEMSEAAFDALHDFVKRKNGY